MNELIKSLEQEQLKNEVPNFGPGDTVRVHVKIVEGKRERVYESICGVEEQTSTIHRRTAEETF